MSHDILSSLIFVCRK